MGDCKGCGAAISASGNAWFTVETSNPGAQILAYARGIVRDGRLLGGMALVDEQIDIESLKAFSLHCTANGYTYDYYVKDARNHEQVLSAIALAGFGQITWAGGRLGVVWAAQDQPLSGVVNMATIKKGQFQVDYNLSNAADGIEYTYLDAATWETKTLRVPAPGITTMLNPAQVAGEGVTSEAHAACLARWHLAQSLFQYKDIGYSTDIEHMSYQRLSILAMQHDMTQWGFGGRVSAAVNAAGTITLTLDEPVPAPASGNAYIGLRIPGERVYRVMRVRMFTGESNIVELLDPWPADAALPGDSAANPAHDTLWVYDFKQTPGKRVRVVSIEPESDLKGAAVRVVEEGPEFWNYVLTGEYIPPPNDSLLPTRPVASNLRVTEQQVVQGDTQFTELTATFDITGPVGSVLVLAAGQDQELLEVAQTQTRTATWRIPQADVYSIVVRPFSPDGEAGVAVSLTYATAGADVPPVLVDLFDVQERSGGVRLYTWGWLAETMRSADFAGVEIRYTAGHVTSPVWDDMTPVGDTGYHTAAFEAVVPESGEWTFACRSRNTSGELSIGMRVVQRTLGKNLGQSLNEITQEQVAQQEAIDAANEAAVLAGLKAAQALALMGTEYDPAAAYETDTVVYKDGRMYRAKQAVPIDQPPPNASYWLDVGTVTQAQSATSGALSQLRVDIDEQGVEFAAAFDQVSSGLSTVTTAIKAVGGGGNLLQNTMFSDGTQGWTDFWSPDGAVLSALYTQGESDPGVPKGMTALIAISTAGQAWIGAKMVPVEKAGQVYMSSVYISGSVTARVTISFYDAAGGFIAHYLGDDVLTGGGDSLGNYVRSYAQAPVPENARFAKEWLVMDGPGFCRFVRPMLEEVRDGQLEPSPWSAGASEQAASETLTLDVNGYVSGTQSMNDGKRSSFSILATVFRVISTFTGMGMEWQDGYLRIWKSTAQLLLGHTFGAGDLVLWYGPNVGASNCTKANGKIWFDDSGDAYFGGTVTSGVLTASNQSSAVGNISVSTGPFNSNGNTRVVQFGMTYSRGYNESGTPAPSGTISATVNLERRFGSEAWSVLSSMTVVGERVVYAVEPGGSYPVSLALSGSSTFWDTGGGGNPEYRVTVTNNRGWPVLAGAGTQRTYVGSTEYNP